MHIKVVTIHYYSKYLRIIFCPWLISQLMNYIEILHNAFPDNSWSTEMDSYHAQTILRELCFKSISDSFTLLLWLCGKKNLLHWMYHLRTSFVASSQWLLTDLNLLWGDHTDEHVNGSLFPDDIFRCIFMNEKFCILVRISLKFVPKCPIDNNPALVQIMAWRQIGNKPLSEPMLTWITDTYSGLGDELNMCQTKTSGSHHSQTIVFW